jgi:hypothetical protein
MKRLFTIYTIITIIFSSCSTKKFVCSSIPNHALITAQSDTILKNSIYTPMGKETPATIKLQFWGRDDKYFLTAEKRGYYPTTKVVTKNSELANTFELKRIEGVSDAIYSKENLKNATFYLLPPKIQFLYHKGAGAFDRYEPDVQVAKKIKENLIKNITEANKSSFCMLNMEGKDACKSYRDSLPEDIFNYLFNLSEKRLNYYPSPASIEAFINKNGNIREALKNHPAVNSHCYFVCLFGKSISATAGRMVGQALLTSSSSSYSPTTDSGTTLNIFIIDAETLEVVHINKMFYKENMAKPEELKKVNDGLTNYLLSL